MPNLQCKPGDLARVTSAWNPANVGRIVLVGKLNSPGEWSVTVLGEPVLSLTKNRRRMRVDTRVLCYDYALKPLRGNLLGDDIDTKEPTQHDENEFRRFLNNLQSSTEKEGA